MEFFMLGPLRAEVRDEPLDLGSARQQIVLAALLLDVNRPVIVARLMEAVYGRNSPATSRAQVQSCVSALRRLFGSHGHPRLIVTTPGGYALRIPGEWVDAERFAATVVRARRLRELRRHAEAARLFRAALSLWRGPPFDGIRSEQVRSAASRLTETRISTIEECVQLELDIGAHRGLVSELGRLVEEHPARERFRAQLMTALYRSGRRMEALEVYRRTRQTWAAEFGIEPNADLRRLHQDILDHHDILDHRESREAPPGVLLRRGGPVMLPPGVEDFTGRAGLLAILGARLSGESAGLAVPVTVLVGQAGVGKTSLALQVAHGSAERYPDGRLYAALHGSSAHRASAEQVLEQFLVVLGMSAAALPEGLEERAERYRDLLAGRRALVVLDDAANESQVLPLLPGTPGSAVMVTSRRRLPGLAGAVHVEVPLFAAGQSAELLARIVGAERARAEPEAAAALAGLCGHLPLALRVAGARLAARPELGLRHLVERLRDETRRLDELRFGDVGIRAGLSVIHDGLTEGARRLFRRLAILDVPAFPVWAGAALLNRSPADTADLLDELADAQLVETAGVGRSAGIRYRFHDLIRVYAKERLAREEPPAERSAALARLLGALLHVAEAVHDRHLGRYAAIHGDAPRWALPERLVGRLAATPAEWPPHERHLLISGVGQAARAGLTELCWDLAVSLVPIFEARLSFTGWRETHDIALAAARRAGDRRGEGAVLTSLSALCRREQRPEEARRLARAAVVAFEEAGDARGAALAGLGLVAARRVGLIRLRGARPDAQAFEGSGNRS
ncbi:BTAD domain-containing putative transcriptional regulator [Nonomuraea sp. NPDC002799]